MRYGNLKKAKQGRGVIIGVIKVFPIFETERFIMREMVVDDVDDMYHYYSNAEMMKFTSTEVHRSKDEALNRIKNYHHHL